MTRIPKYRWTTALLTIAFCVFNAGVPIVVAVCPMAAEGTAGVCGSCSSFYDDGMEGFTAYQDRSCCETVYVPEGNKNEFLKAGTSLTTAADVLSVTGIVPPDFFCTSNLYQVHFPSCVPLHNGDLPVFLSSLLI